jgi:nucleotide-binding universal stress UspA family protein
MLRRVLVATDGSEHAARAEVFAARLTTPEQPLEIELLYVCPQLGPRNLKHDPLLPWHLDPPRLSSPVVAQANAVLHAAECRIRGACEGGDVRIWCRFLGSDDVAGWIVHEADRACADLIVLGGREHHGLGSWLDGGGVCSVVLRRTHRPVLMVP